MYKLTDKISIYPESIFSIHERDKSIWFGIARNGEDVIWIDRFNGMITSDYKMEILNDDYDKQLEGFSKETLRAVYDHVNEVKCKLFEKHQDFRNRFYLLGALEKLKANEPNN